MSLRAKVLTISDRSSSGEREDLSGPALVRCLADAGFDVIETRIVSDGIDPVARALIEMTHDFAGLIVTTGGTGFSPRDLTPEATASVLEREAPGFGELMRATHPFGALSRGRSGILGRCVVVNTPGSPTGAVESVEALLTILPHALGSLNSGEDVHPPETGGSTATSS